MKRYLVVGAVVAISTFGLMVVGCGSDEESGSPPADVTSAPATIITERPTTAPNNASTPPAEPATATGVVANMAEVGTGACALLTQKEVDDFMGEPMLKGKSSLVQTGFGEDQTCSWFTQGKVSIGALLSLAITPPTEVKNDLYPTAKDKFASVRAGCQGETVAGLGDDAYACSLGNDFRVMKNDTMVSVRASRYSGRTTQEDPTEAALRQLTEKILDRLPK